MANKATVSVELDTASLKKGIADVVKDLSKIQEITVDVDTTQAVKSADDISGAYEKASNESKKKIGELESKLRDLAVAGKQATPEFGELRSQLSSARAEAAKLAQTIADIEPPAPEGFAKFKESLAGGDAGGALGGLTNGLAAAFPLAGALSAGMDILSSTVGAVAGAFSDAYNAGKQFNDSLKQISVQTGLTGADLGKIEEGAKNAFLRGVGESADEAAKTLGSLRQVLGDAVPLENLDEAAIRANQVAKSLGTETPELVGKLSPLIKQYGISFDDALNLVASGAQKGVTDIGGYLDTIQEFTPNLKEAGFSAEEFSGLLGRAGEVGLKDFAKVGDGIKEVQNRLKSGDLKTQLESIGGETSKKLQDIAKLGQQGAISGKQVLTQSIQEIDKAFADNKISDTLRGQLLTTLGGSIAEDIGSEAYSKIFSAPVDVEAVKKAATAAGQIIDQTIPPPDFGRIFELAKLEIGQALNTVYQAVIVPIINPIIEGFGKIKDAFAEAFGGNGGANQVIAVLKTIGNVVGGIVSAAFSYLVGVIKIVLSVFTAVFNIIGFVVNIFKSLYSAITDAINNSTILSNVFNFLGNAGRVIVTVITNLGSAIVGLVQALASFDLGKIEAALGAFGNLTKEQNNAAAATKKLVDQNKQLNNAPPPPPPPPPPGANNSAKEYAEALKSAREELAGLTKEQQKARDLAQTEVSGNDAELAKKRIAIEEKYAIDSLETERKALQSKGELRTIQEAIINKKIEILKEENARKIADIDAKAKQEQIKAEQEQEKKLEELTGKFAQRRLDKLKNELAAGNTAIATELIASQRRIIESGLQSSIDAIVEQTPEFQKGIAELNSQLAAGLSVKDFKDKAALLRQGILQGLQGEGANTKNIFALQIRDTYESAADEIAKGTAEIVKQIREQQIKQSSELFADSLRGIGEALRSVDFATIYGEAADKAADLNEQQEKLIENLKTGETTYQDAVDELRNLGSQQEESTSAFAKAIAASFQSIADQQAQAAEDGINKVNEILERRRQIILEEVELEKAKASEIKALQDQGIQDKEVYEQALADIEKRYTQEKANLKKEDEKISKEATEVQSAALNQLAVSAGAAFASLVAGGENAGEALKKVVGQTVGALLDLYTPSILALFSSIIPPPFGQLAGLAAVQGLKVLLQQALAGFEEGGFTGNGGTSQVAGVVHGQEFVMTAAVTKRNRALLEHLHSGKSVESFPALQKMLADNQISTIPVTELQLMRGELSAIRQRLDSMPNGIQGQMGVDVNVGMDTYLYERDRHRMHVRRLRG